MGTEVIYELTGREPGSPAKWLKNSFTPGIETISDPVIVNFISKLHVHMNQITEVIVGSQVSIYLLNIKIGYVPEDYSTIWRAMGDITKKLISHGSVLDNI